MSSSAEKKVDHSAGTGDSSVSGLIIIDHGSRDQQSNELLVETTRRLASDMGHRIVEPAHMDLAEPTLDQAFDRCVARGARTIVVVPFFLLPGRHWKRDIPALASAAAARHPGVRWLVTAPLGLHPLMSRIIQDRFRACLSCSEGAGDPCEICELIGGCSLRGSTQPSEARRCEAQRCEEARCEEEPPHDRTD